MTPQGILLFAHGARDPAWAQPFEAVAQRLAQRGQAAGVVVRLAFLEFLPPTLPDAAARMAREDGCREVTVVPLFLGAGGHVRKDLPRLMQELRAQHPDTAWHLSVAVGETEWVIQAMADAAWALADQPLPGPSSVQD